VDLKIKEGREVFRLKKVEIRDAIVGLSQGSYSPGTTMAMMSTSSAVGIFLRDIRSMRDASHEAVSTENVAILQVDMLEPDHVVIGVKGQGMLQLIRANAITSRAS
jgi:hypothetical protein